MAPGGSVPQNAAEGTKQPAPVDRSSNWLDVLKAFAMPLVVALLGYWLNASLNERQQRDADNRMYIEMMGRREDAESSLRKDMFKYILDTFMSKDPKTRPEQQLDQEILSLELLAYNFHESLDIGPLFQHVRQRIPAGPEEAYRRNRLERVAIEVCERQIASLAEENAVARGDADLSELKEDRVPRLYWAKHGVVNEDASVLQRVCLSLGDTESRRRHRQFLLEVVGFDAQEREIQVRLVVTKQVSEEECRNPNLNLDSKREVDINFSAGLFDFPMIDSTRLSEDERSAVAVTHLTEHSAGLRLVYYPGTRASLRDKRFIDDMLNEVRHSTAPQKGKSR